MKKISKTKDQLNNQQDWINTKNNSDLAKMVNSVLEFPKKEEQKTNLNLNHEEINFNDPQRIVDELDYLMSVDRGVRENEILYNLSEYKEIFTTANTRANPNSIKLNEALLIMLQIVHTFKYVMDETKEWYNKNTADTIPFHLADLLKEVLYEINGTDVRRRDIDPYWEMELDKILELPNWSYELDSAITQFLLLPLYYATHQHLDEQHE